MDEFEKCRFCCWYDNFIGCRNLSCCQYDRFEVCKEKIIEKARESGFSVADIVALMNLD